jgi:hypothetical protein
VEAGVRYRCHPIGVLLVDEVTTVGVEEIDDAEAVRAGFRDRAELLEYLAGGPAGPLQPAERIFRVALRHVGDEDAKPVAFEAELTDDDVASLEKRLTTLDRGTPWTHKTLELIAAHPHRRAGDLAEMLGRERLEFKADVRKLKALGLTISHEVGYSLSPRGTAYLARTAKRRGRRKRSQG